MGEQANLYGWGWQPGDESPTINYGNQFALNDPENLAVARFRHEQSTGTASGFTAQESLTLGQGVREFAKGAAQGATVVANELTFHAIEPLNQTAEQLIAENPVLQNSALCGSIAREAITQALTAGAATLVLKGVSGAASAAAKSRLGGVIIRQLPGKAPCIVQTAGKVIKTGAVMYLTAETAIAAAEAADAAWDALIDENASPQEVIKRLADAGLALANLGYSAIDIAKMAKSMSKDGFKKFFASCFAAGTGVLTDRGWVAIEDIKPGDMVLSRSEAGPDSPCAFVPVGRTVCRPAAIIKLKVAGRTLRVTPSHPFWLRGKEWVRAGNLQPRNEVAGQNGDWLPVEEITDTGEQVPVYNFSVPGSWTYFVGDVDWGFALWAHNDGECLVAANSAEVQEAVAAPKAVDSNGNQLGLPAPKNVTTPNAAARAKSQGEYIDPLTNKVVKTTETLAADHIFPKARIKELPGFNKLTPEQQSAVLNNLENFQGLPQSLNASKGSKIDWSTYKGQPLNAEYTAELAKLQQTMKNELQAQINAFLAGGK